MSGRQQRKVRAPNALTVAKRNINSLPSSRLSEMNNAHKAIYGQLLLHSNKPLNITRMRRNTRGVETLKNKLRAINNKQNLQSLINDLKTLFINRGSVNKYRYKVNNLSKFVNHPMESKGVLLPGTNYLLEPRTNLNRFTKGKKHPILVKSNGTILKANDIFFKPNNHITQGVFTKSDRLALLTLLNMHIKDRLVNMFTHKTNSNKFLSHIFPLAQAYKSRRKLVQYKVNNNNTPNIRNKYITLPPGYKIAFIQHIK